jgi:hypothetical protein
MLLDVDGSLSIELKPTIGLEYLTKFLIPNEYHCNQNPHAYAHSNQIFQFDLPFGF